MADEKTILVVDDDEDVRDMIGEYLAGHGFLVLSAENGAAMWRVLEKNSVDLVLLDRTMPGGDGLALVPELRATYDVGVILVTALANDEQRIGGLEVGVDDYVAKPFDWRELLARINNVLRRVSTPRSGRGGGKGPRLQPGYRVQRRMAAVLCADVADYVRLMQEDEAGTLDTWWVIRLTVIDPAVERHGGRIVKLTGDGFFAEFRTVDAALACAIAIQDGVKDINAGRDVAKQMQFRMGINWCPIVADTEDIYGDGVNLAARLEALAEPGGICVSEPARAATTMSDAVRMVAMGAQKLKNVARPLPAYAVRWCGSFAAATAVGS